MSVKRPLIFVHGNWGDEFSWQMLASKFKAAGYPVLCLSMPGRGDDSVGKYSINDFSEVISAAVTAQEKEFGTRPIVFGHSLGATTALKAAEKIEIGGLVLVAPSSPVNMPQPSLSWPMLRLFLPWILQTLWRRTSRFAYKPPLWAVGGLFRGWPKEAIEQAHQLMHKDSSRTTYEFARRLAAAQVDPLKIKCPILCVAGTLDEVCPPKIVEKLSQWLSDARFEKIEGSHFLIMEREAVDMIFSLVSQWLENQGACSTRASA